MTDALTPPPVETIHVVSACSMGPTGLVKAKEAFETEVTSTPNDSIEALVQAGLQAFDEWGSPRSDAPPTVQPFSAFVELDAALALAKTNAPAQEIVVHLLINPDDAAQRHTRKVMEQWLAHTSSSRSVDIAVKLIDVSISGENGERVSALDVGLPTTADSRIIDQASQRIVLQTMAIFAQSTTSSPVYVNMRAGSTLAKQSLTESMKMASAIQRARRVETLVMRGSETGPIADPNAPQPVRVVVEAKGQPREPFDVPGSIATGVLHHRFDQAVRLVHHGLLDSDERRAAVTHERLGGYVDHQDGSWVLTDSAWSLIESFPYVEGDSHSACAELLIRHPDPGARQLGARLHDHILRWHVTGLFRKNLVPEIVLHDEPHAQAVDRHVAALLAPSLASGAVDPGHVYLVALAAWLHDWGHASGGTVEVSPTAGKDVRTLHGLLSAQRIEDPYGLLRDQLGLSPAEQVWTALLAKHHQSWTSCDDRGLDADDKTAPRLARRYGLDATSFVADFDRTRLAASRVHAAFTEIDFPTAQSLLAVLRVADGADLGVHRTPHMTVPAAISVDEWTAVYSRAVDAISVIEEVSGATGLKDELDSRFSPSAIAMFLRTPFDEHGGLAEDELEKRVLDLVAKALPSSTAPVSSNGSWSSSFTLILADLRDTLVHLVKQQVFYYPRHASVGGVYLVPARRRVTSAGDVTVFRALVRLRPERAHDPRLNHLTGDEILDVVRHDLMKEVGMDNSSTAGWRKPMWAALGRIGVELDSSPEGVTELLREQSVTSTSKTSS